MTQTEIETWVAAQDWSLRDAEIARKTGLSQTTVRNRRMKAGITKGAVSYRKSKWADVDWSKTDTEIAKERGVSRQCAQQYRKRFASKP